MQRTWNEPRVSLRIFVTFDHLAFVLANFETTSFRPDEMGKVDGIFVETHLNDAIFISITLERVLDI